ncbi:Mediator of RNA polymerase II transcription subunit 6 [Tupaia chinensis]|uniref:Mediator of RNA polymerase II transcription subunit 6 n=1 Tax=Tupaia chinensis TaxID=246437 RepID=L9LC68_TUPCH|nr:Mediator of RNA polymerase II transcription subunit 6 [Tupaia chinensis]
MAAVDIRDNLLGISWVDSSWIPILNSGSVLGYFSQRSNPFYDRTCSNEMVKMQRLILEHLNQMVGVEYILLHAQEPILFVIRKQQQQSPAQVIPLADYSIITGVIYPAPDLGSVINSRVLTAVHGIQSALMKLRHTAGIILPKDIGGTSEIMKNKIKPNLKPRGKKNQRQYADALLVDLRQKFPPKFVQQKTEKSLSQWIRQGKRQNLYQKLKSEEETTKNVQQTVSTKGPPEKWMRLQ